MTLDPQVIAQLDAMLASDDRDRRARYPGAPA